MLPGMMMPPGLLVGGGVAPAVLTFRGSGNSSSNSGSYTSFSSIPLGPASEDRYVVVAASAYAALSQSTSPSATMVVNGVSLTRVVGMGWSDVGARDGNVSIFGGLIPAGTSASTFNLSYSRTMQGCAFGLYTITGLQSTTPTQTRTETNTINVPQGGVVIGAALIENASGTPPDPGWSTNIAEGATLDLNLVQESQRHYAASASGLSAQTSRQFDAGFSSFSCKAVWA